MDHGLGIISPILEILEIEVCNILYNPGNIGKRSFTTSSYPGNIGKRIFSTSSCPGNSGSYDPYSVLSWKYWIVRSILSPILEILEIEVFNILYNPGNIGKRIFFIFSYPGNIGKRIFSTSSYPGNIGSYDPYSVLSWKY